jgi:CMP-N-acetylneuraminic acid synthetase
MTASVAALVPMRHDSERVRGKNYRLFHGRPLYHHVVTTLLAAPEVTTVVIDTDSPTIKADAGTSFPDRVVVVDRPEHLRAGETPMNEVLLHTIGQVRADWYLQTHSTNPLLRSETVSRALADLWSRVPQCDSLFSVTRMQTRLWWDAQRAVNHDPAVLLRTQDLPPVYEENSNLYVFTADSLRQHGNRIGGAPVMFEIDRMEAWDIDEELDFEIAEFLYSRREGLR